MELFRSCCRFYVVIAIKFYKGKETSEVAQLVPPYAMKAYGRVEIQFCAFLASVLTRGRPVVMFKIWPPFSPIPVEYKAE